MTVHAIQIGPWAMAVWLLRGMYRRDVVVSAAVWLAVAAGGLLWETFVPWMPADLRTVILRSAVTVLELASMAVVMSRRSKDARRAVVALCGAAAIASVVLRYHPGEYRSEMILVATVLAVVAATVGVHLLLARHVLDREAKQAAASVDTLWATGTTWAVVLSGGLVVWWLQPMPLWVELLFPVGCTAAAIALLTVGEAIALMWRYPGFAAAYAVEMSHTRIYVRITMLGYVVLLSPEAAVPGIVQSLGGSPELVRNLSWMAAAWIGVGIFRAMRIIRREAVRQHRSAMTGPASAAVRSLAMDDPVYRLLPGMSQQRD